MAACCKVVQGDRPTSRHLHLPWLYSLPDEDTSRNDHHRPHAERESARALRTQSDDVGQGKQAPARPRAASAPDEDAQRPLPVFRALLLLAGAEWRLVASP